MGCDGYRDYNDGYYNNGCRDYPYNYAPYRYDNGCCRPERRNPCCCRRDDIVVDFHVEVPEHHRYY